MEKKPALLLIVLFLVSTAYSQTVTPSVISTNGEYNLSPQGSLAWTIGEPVSETYTGSTNVTTMGFHQPEELAIATLIKEQGSDKVLLVYPNPVQDALTVNFGSVDNGNYQLALLDGLGRTVLKSEMLVAEKSQSTILSLGMLSSGNYYLNISSNAFSKTIKINKIK